MKRINLLASLCANTNSLVDIGTDHAYVPILAIKDYNVRYAFACDVSIGPLNNAKINIKKNNLEEQIETILSNGLDNINFPFETLLISGMGGILITEILKNGLTKAKMASKIVLQPNNNIDDVRRFLNENDFEIIDEKPIIESDKYYEIIVAKHNHIKKELSELELEFGPILLKNQELDFIKQLKIEETKLYEILQKINEKERKIDLEKRLERIKEILYAKIRIT